MGTAKDTLCKLAESRLKETRTLVEEEHYDGARYLAGYVVELALKARICDLLNLDEYPEQIEDFKTHDFQKLLTLAGWEKRWADERSEKPDFAKKWSKISAWNPSEMRYEIVGSEEDQARQMIDALDGENGLFSWIKEGWDE